MCEKCQTYVEDQMDRVLHVCEKCQTYVKDRLDRELHMQEKCQTIYWFDWMICDRWWSDLVQSYT